MRAVVDRDGERAPVVDDAQALANIGERHERQRVQGVLEGRRQLWAVECRLYYWIAHQLFGGDGAAAVLGAPAECTLQKRVQRAEE